MMVREEEEEKDAVHTSVLYSCSPPLNPGKSHDLNRTHSISRLKLRNELVKAESLTSTQVIILIEPR